MIVLKVLLCIFVFYLLPIIINIILLVYAYKVSHNKSVTIEYIFLEYVNYFKDKNGDSPFVFFMLFPIVNIFFTLYSFIFLGYCSIKNIRI